MTRSSKGALFAVLATAAFVAPVSAQGRDPGQIRDRLGDRRDRRENQADRREDRRDRLEDRRDRRN
jgi:hypothetical protein